MARTRPTVKEIINLIEGMGGQKVTEEDKKAPWYKSEFAWPPCFKEPATQKPHKKITGKKPAGFKNTTAKKAAV